MKDEKFMGFYLLPALLRAIFKPGLIKISTVARSAPKQSYNYA